MSTAREDAACNVIYLAGCAANSIVPDLNRIKEMNPKGVYVVSRSCSLAALVWYALESATLREGENVITAWNREPAVPERFQEARDRALIRNVRFERERENVYRFMEDAGIRYMPLKGIILQEFYPEPYLREMVDNDILFDEEHRKQLRGWFQERGYTVDDYQVGNCDAYLKKPFYNFEMHTSPFAYFEEDAWREYNGSFDVRLIPDGEDVCRCHLSDEDFYIYMILHCYKHYEKFGIGIRSLLDCYLYTKALGAKMDWGYIRTELSRFGVEEYEKRVNALSEKMFLCPEKFSMSILDSDERKLLYEFLMSGSHGTLETRVRKEIADEQSDGRTAAVEKLRYVRRRLFPSAKYMTSYAPVLAKHRWLIPAGYIYRIVRGSRKHGKELRSEMKIVRKI